MVIEGTWGIVPKPRPDLWGLCHAAIPGQQSPHRFRAIERYSSPNPCRSPKVVLKIGPLLRSSNGKTVKLVRRPIVESTTTMTAGRQARASKSGWRGQRSNRHATTASQEQGSSY